MSLQLVSQASYNGRVGELRDRPRAARCIPRSDPFVSLSLDSYDYLDETSVQDQLARHLTLVR